MMYMHYCKKCHRIMMLTGHKMICPRCTDPLTELRISYLDYVDLDPGDRELQAENSDELPITVLLAEKANKAHHK